MNSFANCSSSSKSTFSSAGKSSLGTFAGGKVVLGGINNESATPLWKSLVAQFWGDRLGGGKVKGCCLRRGCWLGILEKLFDVGVIIGVGGGETPPLITWLCVEVGGGGGLGGVDVNLSGCCSKFLRSWLPFNADFGVEVLSYIEKKIMISFFFHLQYLKSESKKITHSQKLKIV